MAGRGYAERNGKNVGLLLASPEGEASPGKAEAFVLI